MTSDRLRPAILAGAALVLCVAALALFWPGVALYDTVAQYGQVLAGEYEDWHPPVMARVWAVLRFGVGGGAAPMLVLQMVLYWAGLGLIAAALARIDKPRAAIATLVIGVTPLFLGWQGTVLKDAQMLGAMLAAVGLVGWWRLRGVAVPILGWLLIAVLLGYATLVRANAVFATVALVVMLIGPRAWWARGVVALLGVGAVLAVSPVINHGVLQAGSSGVERTEAIYDLAGIAVRAPNAPTGLSADAVRAIVARHCVKPYFWDPLGEPERCNAQVEPLRAYPAATLYRMLAVAIIHAPIAYAGHRLAHWNSTERWLVGAGGPGALPPVVSQPNDLGLTSPGPAAGWWQALERVTVDTPLGWPIAFLCVALVGLGVGLRRGGSAVRDLAMALLVSALLLEASFLLLSIASDLRYHLWSMVATTVAIVLLVADRAPSRREVIAGVTALALVVVSGTIARLALPRAPSTYAAQLL
ncbi:hypothetical protein [Sphingomonas sp. PAMC 26617]|uniref:hypothetical protein n=1 Tax=Sphingomonas sp. PAMC 26617 TaxID=1112216 RepID=UPI0002889F53|nr:hypothetical protein [Sphingomonas sp. PAMC 26617]